MYIYIYILFNIAIYNALFLLSVCLRTAYLVEIEIFFCKSTVDKAEK